MKTRNSLLPVVVATLTIGTFFLQGWRAALFTLLGATLVAGLFVLAARRSPDKG
jgi:hypothetical protein